MYQHQSLSAHGPSNTRNVRIFLFVCLHVFHLFVSLPSPPSSLIPHCLSTAIIWLNLFLLLTRHHLQDPPHRSILLFGATNDRGTHTLEQRRSKEFCYSVSCILSCIAKKGKGMTNLKGLMSPTGTNTLPLQADAHTPTHTHIPTDTLMEGIQWAGITAVTGNDELQARADDERSRTLERTKEAQKKTG